MTFPQEFFLSITGTPSRAVLTPEIASAAVSLVHQILVCVWGGYKNVLQLYSVEI